MRKKDKKRRRLWDYAAKLVAVLATVTVLLGCAGLAYPAAKDKEIKKDSHIVEEEIRKTIPAPQVSEQSIEVSADEAVSAEPGITKDPELEAFDVSDWKLILINRSHPLKEDYSFEHGVISKGKECDARVLEPLKRMTDEAGEQGVSLIVRSPYRSRQTQQELFDKKIRSYLKKGLSYNDAYEAASHTVAVPGASEHEAGLAFDMVTKGYNCLDAGFGDTEAGIWLRDHAHEYGFIIRYQAGKEDITGIEYEPWHLRYVGEEAAAYMTGHGICLEEFTEMIR